MECAYQTEEEMFDLCYMLLLARSRRKNEITVSVPILKLKDQTQASCYHKPAALVHCKETNQMKHLMLPVVQERDDLPMSTYDTSKSY